jgi:hypothetical protein
MITPAYTGYGTCTRPPTRCEIEGPEVVPLYGIPYYTVEPLYGVPEP